MVSPANELDNPLSLGPGTVIPYHIFAQPEIQIQVLYPRTLGRFPNLPTVCVNKRTCESRNTSDMHGKFRIQVWPLRVRTLVAGGRSGRKVPANLRAIVWKRSGKTHSPDIPAPWTGRRV